MQPVEEAASRTIAFIHGGWLTPTCWDSFVSFFESKGYRCLAPAWPGKDRPVEAIRADPSPLAGLGMGEIIDHYDRIIRGLDDPPILIGHSFGALFVQVLLDRGLGSAGIAIDSAPPKGVFALHPASLLAVGRILLIPFGWRKVVRWTFTEFRHAFVDVLVVLVVGASRIYLGAHWLSDVLGGYALGGLWLSLLVAVMLDRAKPQSGDVRVAKVVEEAA
jgi:pimeloyl-ACP methyl ester carboxylesterase